MNELMRMSTAAVAWLTASACVVLAGCDAPVRAETCGVIPEGGCPVGRGGTCGDVACAALYDCVGGSWKQSLDCGRSVRVEGSPRPQTCSGLTLGPDEAMGCAPDLQHPDCPAAAAATCAPCETGCRDFFACTADGWAVVAYCDDSGRVHAEP